MEGEASSPAREARPQGGREAQSPSSTSSPSSQGGREAPHNAEAERSVLGALLLAAERIPEISEILQAEDFHDRRHQLLYGCLLDVSDRGVPVDFVSIGEALRAQGHYQAVGGHEMLVDLSTQVTSAAHVMHHAQIVRQTAILRQLIREATGILEDSYATRPDGEAVQKLLDDSEHRIFSLARGGGSTGADPIQSVIKEAFERIEAQTSHETTGLDTGFYELNEKLCGLNPGDLVIVAARPSMGKTAFALNLVENASLSKIPGKDRRPVCLLFSMEMGRDQIVGRMLCSRARVDAYKLRTNRIGYEERQLLVEAADDLSGAKIFIDDSPSLSVMALRGRARRIQAQHGLDMVVLDYLQLMSHPKAESRQLEISQISRSLKALARELKIPVVALAQLSRAVEQRDPPKPMLSDLRESGSIEQDADVVMMLYREEYYLRDATPDDAKNKAEIIIAKHRNGATGSVYLNFFPSHLRFANPEISVAEPILG